MLSATIAIHWHDDGHPVYSLDIQPSNQLDSRLATAGGDKNVRIWRIRYSETGDPQDTSVEYLSTLRKHTQAVNVVRYDRSGKLLASGGDDGMLIIWTLSKTIVHDFGVQDDEMKESWIVHQIHNSNLEIYDISWSPDSKSIATGSMDNTTKIFNVLTGQKEMEISDHSHYVQGIAWDPLNKFFATQSADRSVNIYTIAMNKGSSNSQLSTSLLSKLMKAETPLFKVSSLLNASKIPDFDYNVSTNKEAPHGCSMPHSLMNRHTKLDGVTSSSDSSSKVQLATKLNYLYHSENLQSFFRRLAFSPDGSLLLVPLGIYKYENCRDDTLDGSIETGLLNTVYIYTRTGLNQSPVCHLPGLSKPAIAVAFCPTMFELSGDENPPVFALPYKMVFAVATHDAVIIYDTERLRPLGILSNLHYLSITDLCWNADGQSLMISSAEGFCSVITFDRMAFGGIQHLNTLSKPPARSNEYECNFPEGTSFSDKEGILRAETVPDKKRPSDRPLKTVLESKKQCAPGLSTESRNAIPTIMPHKETVHESSDDASLEPTNPSSTLIPSQSKHGMGESTNVSVAINATSEGLGFQNEGVEPLGPSKKKRVMPTLVKKVELP